MEFTKCVPVAINLAASLFIISANPSILPPTYSAIAVALSLPECNNRPYNKSDKVILSPAFIPQVASSAAKLFISAFWETVTTSERSAFSKATSAVMIFVVLAGYILSNI